MLLSVVWAMIAHAIMYRNINSRMAGILSQFVAGAYMKARMSSLVIP
jgi:hypothetical protein